MAKRIFAIGDIHGQLDLFKQLEEHIKQECTKTGDDYEIVCTGDIMDRSLQTYDLFLYLKNNPKFSQVLGNHDEFYLDQHLANLDFGMGPQNTSPYGMGLSDANDLPNTIQSILTYYLDDKKTLPVRPSKSDINSLFAAKHAYDVAQKWNMKGGGTFFTDPHFKSLIDRIKTEYMQEPEKIANIIASLDSIEKQQLDRDDDGRAKGELIPQRAKNSYTQEDAICINFLYRVFDGMKEYFKTVPLVKTINANGQNYVLCHSGNVPMNNGKIDLNPKDNWDVLNYRPGNYDSTVICSDRVDNHIVLHGHTRKTEDEAGQVCSIKNGQLCSVNLDGSGGHIKKGLANHSVLRCLELGTENIFTINGVGQIEQKTVTDYYENFIGLSSAELQKYRNEADEVIKGKAAQHYYDNITQDDIDKLIIASEYVEKKLGYNNRVNDLKQMLADHGVAGFIPLSQSAPQGVKLKQQTSPSSQQTPQPVQGGFPDIDENVRKTAVQNLRIAALLDEYVLIKSKWLLLPESGIVPQERMAVEEEARYFEQSGMLKAKLEHDLENGTIVKSGELANREDEIKTCYVSVTATSQGIGKYWRYSDTTENVKNICNLVAVEIKELRDKADGKYRNPDTANKYPQELKDLIKLKNAAIAKSESFDPLQETRLRELLAEQGEKSCTKFRNITEEKRAEPKTASQQNEIIK